MKQKTALTPENRMKPRPGMLMGSVCVPATGLIQAMGLLARPSPGRRGGECESKRDREVGPGGEASITTLAGLGGADADAGTVCLVLVEKI